MGTGDYGLKAGQKDRETKGTDGVKKSFSFPGVWFVFLAGSDTRILTCLAKPQQCCLHRDNILFPETHLKQGELRAKRGCWG